MRGLIANKFKLLIFYIGAVLTPVAPAILWLGVLIFLDLITGILKAQKLKEEIHSSKLKNTATKALLYFIAVIAGHIIDTQFLTVVEWLPAKTAQLIAGFLAVVEFKSLIENISTILGMPILQFLKDYLNKPKK